MSRVLFIFFSLFITLSSFAQDPLAFDELGYQSPFCRLFGYQSGNGVVYASAMGGVPDYDYVWKNLENGEIANNSTWGGLNPGCYEITVTDMVGAVIKDTLCLDSLNPKAILQVVSDDLDSVFWGHIGLAPITVGFENHSINFVNPWDLLTDTVFFFQPQGFEPWELQNDMLLPDYSFEYGGTYTSRLVAVNNNGCTDTTYAIIGLFGPLSISESGGQMFSINTHTITNEIVVKQSGFDEGLLINIYTTSGQLVLSRKMTESELVLTPDFARGIYVYEVLQPETGLLIDSGKLNF